ncbi:hypothetical protein VCCP1040_2564, partial [Vibrio cholerae CP1040(13)]
MPLPITG